jgi:cellulose synthase/poly-beta-1,6-N-acetylglucosamine synthase-like glycosyltransferase
MQVDNIFLIVFWVTFLLCLSTYALYPICIFFLAKYRPFIVKRQEIHPFVSVIISAFNEEKHIESKLMNTLELDYPRDRMEIIVGSDGSTDRTAKLVAGFTDRNPVPPVKLLHFPTNRGKTTVQNDCVNVAKGEILLFMDAASFLNKGAIEKIVRNFADPRVGGVAGRLQYVNTGANLTTESQGIYWRYEVKIREMESRLGSLIGVDGPLYALRRENYVPLKPAIISDFISPLLVLAAGKKVVLDPEAVVNEDPTLKAGQELRTRRRITVRALTALAMHKDLLNLFRHPALAAQIIFHKLLRWFVGPLVIMNFVASIFLSTYSLFSYVLLGYVIFFLLALFGFLFNFFGVNWRVMTIPYYFLLVNLAASLGILDFIRKKQAVTWQPLRG